MDYRSPILRQPRKHGKCVTFWDEMNGPKTNVRVKDLEKQHHLERDKNLCRKSMDLILFSIGATILAVCCVVILVFISRTLH